MLMHTGRINHWRVSFESLTESLGKELGPRRRAAEVHGGKQGRVGRGLSIESVLNHTGFLS